MQLQTLFLEVALAYFLKYSQLRIDLLDWENTLLIKDKWVG